jgi:AbrB family looped-hinge helix DNA binding protein
MSKVTSKRQVTIPKEVADRYGIGPGDEIRWVPSGREIRVVPPGAPVSARLDVSDRLALFDRATERRDRRAHERRSEANAPTGDRGWTRDELYDRGRAR